MDETCKTCMWRLFRFSLYVLIGGLVFMQIEKDKDDSTAKLTFEDSLDQWIKTYNISTENITELLRSYDRWRENRPKPTWSFLNSIYFVLQLITTIGYGNITPVTPIGQTFSIAYAILGIPVTILALQSIGKLVNLGLRLANRPIHRKFHSIHCEEEHCDFLEKSSVCINTICFILTWLIVSAVSVTLDQERSFVTVVYSIFVTYSTVGFGDFIPFEDYRYVFIITVLPGLSFMSSSIDSIVAYMQKSTMLRKRCPCFNSKNCLVVKREARKTSDEAQDTQTEISEHTM